MEKVRVILTNRTASLIRPYPYEEIVNVLKYRKPGWEFSRAAKYNGWDGYTKVLKYNQYTGGNSLGSGIFLAMREKLEKELGIKFVVEDQRKAPALKKLETTKIIPIAIDGNQLELAFEEAGRKVIREYQQECFDAMIASKSGGLILQATGSGKTFIAGLYFSALKGAGVFLVDELTLLDQAQKEISSVLGEPVGDIGDSHFNPKRITVGTIQTIHKNRNNPGWYSWVKSIEAIFIDELHLALNRRNFQTTAAIKPPVIFGLTATLELRKKHIAMKAYELAGPIIFQYPLQQGVEEGFLSKGVAISVQVQNQLESPKFDGKGGWWKRRQFYRELYPIEYLRIIVESKKRNRVLREFIEEAYQRGKYTIVLLERIQHIKELSQELDIPHETVFGEKSKLARIKSKSQFEHGNLRLLIANKVFKKGVDIKRVDVVIDAAGMKSKNDAQQKYGRGVRLCDGKTGLIYIDIADTGNRFEKASISRRSALKRIGVPIFKVDSSLGAKKIFDLAEKKLALVEGKKLK